MNRREDAWMMNGIFHLSDRAWVRMVNHLFQMEYRDDEYVLKEWEKGGMLAIRLTIGCGNRYVIGLRRLDGCVQIRAEAHGCLFIHEKAALDSAVQLREPGIVYAGENIEWKYRKVLEFPGRERTELQNRIISLGGRSAWQVEAYGLAPFLPFLVGQLHGGVGLEEDPLKYFAIYDIVGALEQSLKKGDLTVFDVQKIKQLCRQRARGILAREKRLRNIEVQEQILNAFETDFERMEHMLSTDSKISE